MRVWVFGEDKIEPTLQKWFGSQQWTQEQEAEFHQRLVQFLCSEEAKVLRYANHDPKPVAVTNG